MSGRDKEKIMTGQAACSTLVCLFFMPGRSDADLRERQILRAVSAFTGAAADPGSWRTEKTPAGKPYFALHPEVKISLSDSGTYRAVVLSDEEIGADLQKTFPKEGETPAEEAARLQRLADRRFHPEEAAWVREEESAKRFYLLWTAREAWAKYTGTGLAGLPEDLSILRALRLSLADASAALCRAPAEKGMRAAEGPGLGNEAGIELHWHEAPDGYLLCTCARVTERGEKTVYNYLRI